MTTINEQAADRLEQAADLLDSETLAWCQHDYVLWVHGEVEMLSVCAIGALMATRPSIQEQPASWRYSRLPVEPVNAAAPSDGVEAMMMAAIAIHLAQSKQLNSSRNDYDCDHDVITAWNDSDNRERDQVIEAFRHAAKDLRNNT